MTILQSVGQMSHVRYCTLRETDGHTESYDLTAREKRVLSLPDLVRRGLAEAPDILCGGTPCQAFSIAGRREGLSDDRGRLTLSFVDLADAIDLKRAERGERPCVVFWENVPGVLSSKDNAFGCFLAALAGEDDHWSRQGRDGRTLVLSLDPKGQSRGGSRTPNISAWPNDAAVCSLSQALVRGSIPEKYSLSSTACAGILRRAAWRRTIR